MVAGDRRRPAASNAAETVMGSPPNCTADRARCFIAAPRLVARVRLRSAYALRKPATRQTGASTSSAAGASHAVRRCSLSTVKRESLTGRSPFRSQCREQGRRLLERVAGCVLGTTTADIAAVVAATGVDLIARVRAGQGRAPL